MQRFVALLRRGGVVACPTETLYGLLADALDPKAVDRVVEIKGRPEGEPIAVLLPDVASVERVAREWPEAARKAAARFWPGPLTMLVRAREGLPGPLVKDGRIGVRVPGPSPAAELCRAFGGPLTATSANRSGESAARTDMELQRALGDEVDGVVPGNAPGAAASTIVDMTTDPPRVLREGPIDPLRA